MGTDDNDLEQYFSMGGMLEGTFTDDDLARLESLGPEGALEALHAEIEAQASVEGGAAHRYHLRAMSLAYSLRSEERAAAVLAQVDAVLEARTKREG